MSWEAANAPNQEGGRGGGRGGDDGAPVFASTQMHPRDHPLQQQQQQHHPPPPLTHHQQRQQQHSPHGGGHSGPLGRRDVRSASSETVEAALSRLSRAYAASMQCIGSMNRTDQLILRQLHQQEQQQEKQEQPQARAPPPAGEAAAAAATGDGTAADGDIDGTPFPRPTEGGTTGPTDTAAALRVVRRVANAARTTLERSILLDPLILPHVPTVRRCMADLSDVGGGMMTTTADASGRWDAVLRERRPPPPVISSEAHKSTLTQLAYLSLVNYSDLLQSAGEWNRRGNGGPPTTVLDRGVVPRLQSLVRPDGGGGGGGGSCWGAERPEETQRLAVAALCDASNLDASDPVLWLKLACASRALERIVADGDGGGGGSGGSCPTVVLSKHRRLQRYALDRGTVALPPHAPPNRTVLRAREELAQEPEPDEYVSVPPREATPVTRTLELPRYSWSALGRMLIRACKGEETMYNAAAVAGHPWAVSESHVHPAPLMFGSPTIVVELSPMLVLPPRVLGKICQYLPNPSVWKFEATCRALSVSIMAARATLEESENTMELKQRRQQQQQEQEQQTQQRNHSIVDRTLADAPTEGPLSGEEAPNVGPIDPSNRHRDPSGSVDARSEDQSSKDETRPVPPVPSRQTARAEGHRTSQRLRSQQISTGKKQDREANRKSFNYCFLAATLSCTKEQHDEMIKALRGRKEFGHLFGVAKKDGLGGSASTSDGARASGDSASMFSTSRLEARERVSDASLPSFIRRWNSNNSGPMDLLERYLAHVAVHTEEVFSSDPGGTVGLASCIISAFEVLLLRSGSHQSLTPRFFQSVAKTGSLGRSLELFAMDVLHAELILRQCDRYVPKVVEYDDDANLVSIMIPQLLDACDEMEQSKKDVTSNSKLDAIIWTKFHMVQARCYWLTAGFFLWRSRFARAAYDSREAEDEGISFIEVAIKCFNTKNLRSVQAIKTPQLVSPGRQDAFWKEISPKSLSKFRDEIQASSVVSHARQQFQELVSLIEKPDDIGEPQIEVSPQAATALSRIGQTLFERYNAQYGDVGSKLNELIDDFLTVHGDYLFVPRKAAGSLQPITNMAGLNSLIPLESTSVSDLASMSNPSILTMLVTCLNMDPANHVPIAQLLTRLVLIAKDFHGSLLRQISDSRAFQRHTDEYNIDDGFSDSENDSVMSDDELRQSSSHKNDDEKKVRQCGHLIKFLIDRLIVTIGSNLSEEQKSDLILSDEFSLMLKSTLDISNKWFPSTINFLSVPDDGVDQGIFLSLLKILKISQIVVPAAKNLEKLFFCGMVRTIISQRDILEGLTNSQGDRASRNARQRLCIQRAQYLGQVALQIGVLLSTNLAAIDDYVITRGALFESESGHLADTIHPNFLSSEEVTVFLLSARWLRKYAAQVDTETTAGKSSNVCSSFDRPVIKELRIPISTMVIGLCGGAAFSRAQTPNGRTIHQGACESDPLCLIEFFDSDASTNDWEQEQNSGQNASQELKKELLRVICHAVYCTALVLEQVDDKDILSNCNEGFLDPELGSLLPLVSVRVLNFFADELLLNFGPNEANGKNRQCLWEEEFPPRAEQTGQLLDTNLHKAYRWLYGFVLVGEQHHQQNSGKELAHTLNPFNEVALRCFRPESTVAAAQLYRCIVRAYTGGRRTPPKAALELVSSALPPQDESKRSRALREFVFASDKTYFDLDNIVGLVTQRDRWEIPFASVRDSILANEESLDHGNTPLETSEAMQVRRGLSSRLASGPLPIVSESGRHKETGVDDDRTHTIRQEEEISKKFTAIIDDLCLSEVDNCEGWYRAAQCLTMKAEIIADRLGLNLGFARIKDFSVPSHRSASRRHLTTSELESEQEKEEVIPNHICFLGNDLSVYVGHSWSSFKSLLDCGAKTRSPGSDFSKLFRNRYSVSHLSVWKEIESKYENEDYLGWQESWGGIFVQALRKLSLRFMCIALYILRSKETRHPKDKMLVSEISEALGVTLYTELMASQNYGWPMQKMTAKRKRDLGGAARDCFQSAIELVENSSGDDDASEDRATWDLLFMIGKCNEKIAGTYRLEAFPDHGEGDTSAIRRYEDYMATALELYSKALSQARKIEEDGGYLVEQAGGSAHGSTEVLYRLVASRLKCLIDAVSSHEDELELAEMEALRLTEKYWVKKPECGEDGLKEKHIRDRVWMVLADIVDGLAQCRQIQPFFHRSVYRHAQALMWSPALNDPLSRKGSLDMVPATRSFQIRGLNNSTPAANSAEVVMSALFDKKRSHLCAVWVTTSTASSPFQVLNNSTRKYDSVRGKYVAAYLESLHLCNRRSEIETFMKWMYSSKRDLPAYFQASAMAGGGKPVKPQSQDPLLVTGYIKRSLMEQGMLLSAKRQANSVMADVLIQEISSDSKRAAPETYLKHAYACYLRLNCTVQDLKKTRAWKYGVDSVREVDALCGAYLALSEIKGEVDTAEFGDWSGGARKSAIFQAALEKCKVLFPSLSGTFFSKKTSSKSNKGTDQPHDPDEGDGSAKRKQGADDSPSNETTKASFEVAVPKGLSSGDTFFSSVKVGEAEPIKVKLTVPSGNHSTLRFNLDVPKVTTQSVNKRAKQA